MHSQLYFLLPDIAHTEQLCDDVAKLKVSARDLHVVVKRDSKLDFSTLNQRCEIKSSTSLDRDYLFEWTPWRVNLIVFFLSLAVMLALIMNGQLVAAQIPPLLMVATFSLGYFFVWRMPNVHWRDSLTAIKHGEILLIIDLPKHNVHSIDRIVHRTHPEAVGAGVCWKM